MSHAQFTTQCHMRYSNGLCGSWPRPGIMEYVQRKSVNINIGCHRDNGFLKRKKNLNRRKAQITKKCQRKEYQGVKSRPSNWLILQAQKKSSRSQERKEYYTVVQYVCNDPRRHPLIYQTLYALGSLQVRDVSIRRFRRFGWRRSFR